MKPLSRALMVILGVAGLCAGAKPPRWSVDLERQYGLQRFDRPVSAPWTGQEGVLFLTPDQVLVYQVNRLSQAPALKSRNAAGGSGNFMLEIRVFAAGDGHLIRSLRLPTNAELSSVHPLKSGKLLVRTGDILYIYSADFTELLHRSLPILHKAPRESWQLAVSPSRDQIVLVHSQIFHAPQFLMDGTTITEGESKADVEFVDPQTLTSGKSFHLDHTLAFWAAVDNFLISSDPAHSYSRGELGILDEEGKWTPLTSEVKIDPHDCPFDLQAAGHHTVALFGCGRIIVLTSEGKVLYQHSEPECRFTSATANSEFLAVQCDRYRLATAAPGASGFTVAKPDHVEVHDIDKRKHVLSQRFRTAKVSYAVSERGALVIADGPSLTLRTGEE